MPPIVILSHTQIPENIGAIARAMGNFGLKELRLINPHVEPTHQTAIAMSAGNEHVLKNAQIFSTLSDALFNVDYAFATSARKRFMEKQHISVQDIHVDHTKKTAFVFGCEKNGLSNAEMVLCQKIISIDVCEQFSSLNIAQAAVIIFHEVFSKQHQKNNIETFNTCNIGEKQFFLSQLEKTLDQINFWRVPNKKPTMWQNIQNPFTRNIFTKQEVQTLTGIMKDIQKRLK